MTNSPLTVARPGSGQHIVRLQLLSRGELQSSIDDTNVTTLFRQPGDDRCHCTFVASARRSDDATDQQGSGGLRDRRWNRSNNSPNTKVGSVGTARRLRAGSLLCRVLASSGWPDSGGRGAFPRHSCRPRRNSRHSGYLVVSALHVLVQDPPLQDGRGHLPYLAGLAEPPTDPIHLFRPPSLCPATRQPALAASVQGLGEHSAGDCLGTPCGDRPRN